MDEKRLYNLLIAFGIIVLLAVIGSYITTTLIFKEPDYTGSEIAPQGPKGEIGPSGSDALTGPQGDRGPPGPGSLLRTRILSTNLTTYWNYNINAHIFPFLLENWYPSNEPISLIFECSKNTIFSYQNYKNSVSFNSIKTLHPSTSSQGYDGDQRTSNYAGFDYIIIRTKPGVGGYPPDTGRSNFYLDEKNKFYLLVRVNILEYRGGLGPAYNGIFLDQNDHYVLKPGRFVLSYYSSEE